MSTKTLAINPKVFFSRNKPSAVLLDIKDYKKILERLEDLRDIRELEKIKKQKLTFKPLEEFLKELGV